MEKVVSVIPIKLSNERFPGKNTKNLGEKPLIYYIQNTLLACKQINEKYVFCSSESIKNYLLKGIEFLKRPEELDSNMTNFTQIFSAFYKIIDADIYVYTHATAPFITSDTIIDCINHVRSGNYDSAFSAIRIQDFLWKNGEAFNFDPENVPRSQDIAPLFRETSGVYVFRKEVFEKRHRRVGINPYIKEVGFKEAVDINIPEDFKIAQLIVNKDMHGIH